MTLGSAQALSAQDQSFVVREPEAIFGLRRSAAPADDLAGMTARALKENPALLEAATAAGYTKQASVYHIDEAAESPRRESIATHPVI